LGEPGSPDLAGTSWAREDNAALTGDSIGRPAVSSVTGEGIDELKAELIKRLPQPEIEWVIREG
jgi:hypothetical protein